MEARLLIAFVLMFLVLFLTPYLYKPAPGPKSTAPVTPQQAHEVAKPPAPAPAAVPPAVIPTSKTSKEQQSQSAAVQAGTEEPYIVDTALYKITFSNRGAVVKSWLLKKYQDSNGKPLELVNTGALDKIPAPFSIEFKDRKPDYDANQVLYVAKPSTEEPGVDYEYSNGQTTVRKTFRFGQNSYRSQITSEVSAPGTTIPHYLVWRGGFGDPTIHNAPSVERTTYYPLAEGRLFTKTARDAKNGPVTVSGTFAFAGIEDPYFTAAVLPSGSGSIDVRTISDTLPYGDKTESFVGVGIGGDGINKLSMFVGPKDSDILKAVDPKLGELIDWGRWFGFLAKPLFYVLNWTNDHLTHNFGWAIVLVTVAINMLTLPLRLTSMKSAKKMQRLQPQIAAINAKYKNIGLRDPKQQDKNAEVMALYKQHGVNPLGRLPADGSAIAILHLVLYGAHGGD